MPRHAAPGTNVVEGLEPAIRRDHHQGPQSADSDISKVASPDAMKRHNRPFAAFHRYFKMLHAARRSGPWSRAQDLGRLNDGRGDFLGGRRRAE